MILEFTQKNLTRIFEVEVLLNLKSFNLRFFSRYFIRTYSTMQSFLPMRVLVVIFFLLTITHASTSWQRPQRNDESADVADAVKYLQELDNYYSHLSRPR